MIQILVYSPSFRMRALIVGIVTCQGVEVESVTSREALFRRCKEKLFDRLIIEDYSLFIDGSCTVSQLRTHFATRPRILLLSEAIEQSVVVQLLSAGVDEYMLLPLSAERLRKKVCSK